MQGRGARENSQAVVPYSQKKEVSSIGVTAAARTGRAIVATPQSVTGAAGRSPVPARIAVAKRRARVVRNRENYGMNSEIVEMVNNQQNARNRTGWHLLSVRRHQQ